MLAGGTTLTGNTQTLPALYSLPASDFHDILHGNNGYAATTGYDLTTGRGTPVANLLVPALAGYQMPGHLTIQTEPPASVVVGASFGLTIQVNDGLGNPVNGGTVAVALANNPGSAFLGGTTTEPVVNGLATFTDLSLSQPGTGYTLTVTGSGITGTQTTTAITVTTGSTPTSVVATASPGTPVFGQAMTLTATVSVVSPGTGIPTGSVTFKEGATILGMASLTGGVAQLSATPSAAGVQTITALYGGDANDQPSSFVTGTLTIDQATPTLTWAAPASITAGTPLGPAQLDAVATFNGVPLAGVFTYSPLAGTVLATGTGQVLSVSFTPSDSSDFKAVTASVPINVVPQPPPRLLILSEQPVFRRPVKKGKPVGKAVLSGFRLNFNLPLDAAAATKVSNYELDTVTTKRVKKKLVPVLQSVKKFTVTYTPSSDSVSLTLTGTQTFPTGGRLTVLPGISGNSGGVLSGTTVFTIAPGGKKIGPT